MQKYLKLREEPLKSAIREDFFKDYHYTQLGNIDFVIAFPGSDSENLKSILWAEAKQGKKHDIFESFIQLILTIGKERTFEKYQPPKYIGAFDAEKFALIEFHDIQEIFYQNDFNWNVTPSNHETKEFKQLHALCENLLQSGIIPFKYESDSKELTKFIKQNFKPGGNKLAVTKNNFVFVFQKWAETVKDSININWETAQKSGIIAADFFLADLLSSENESLKENLSVVLKKTKYELEKKINQMGLFEVSTAEFLDNQKAHREFWAKYKRPPKAEYWGYIIERRDLLVPQDIRERKGSFFTPQIWVEKSQQYIAEVLGENWQDDFYIWDCCAGTGNLLNGLANYDNVWASTLDKADIDVMIDRIHNGWNMPENHVFQFDFLNDNFSECPEELQNIINDENKRKKLVIYINPPYAEAGSTFGKKAKTGVSNATRAHRDYTANCGTFAKRELFIQFFMRIYLEIPGCILAEFSTLKILQAPYFKAFRQIFQAQLSKGFIVPADTFDNVKGQFPIGFFVWELSKKQIFSEKEIDVYNSQANLLGTKTLLSYDNSKMLNDWLRPTWKNTEEVLGYIVCNGNDFQHQNELCVLSKKSNQTSTFFKPVNKKNLLESSIYFSVRICIKSNWLNDRDQFLYPLDDWKEDFEFQSDCLIFTLFHGQNRISSEHGINHWIPFTREQLGITKAFRSRFMSDFLSGKIKPTGEKEGEQGLFEIFKEKETAFKVVFSEESKAVYDAGLELWRYYHAQKNANPDASFYDIRKHFQGETNGRMNTKSDDETYSRLNENLKQKIDILADKIAEKVYKYGFLK